MSKHKEGFSFEPRHAFRYLCIFFAIALCLQMAVFLLFPSVYWPDEIYQSQEAAHRLVYGIGVIPWEFRIGVRSWVLPVLIAGIMKSTAWLSSGSSGYIFGIALSLSLLSLTVVWFSFSWCRQYFGLPSALLAGFSTAIWWELIHFGPRAFSEFVAGNLFLPAIYLGFREPREKAESKWRMIFIGLLLGLTVALRMQFGPAVLLTGLWIMSRNWKARFIPVTGGILLVVLIFGVVDALTWSYPFYSYYAYFRENVLNHRASHFGTGPWYDYFRALFTHAGPLAIFALLGVRRSPILGWISLAVLFPHLFVAHKDWRFVYPVLPLMLTLAAIGLLDFLQYLERKRFFRSSEPVKLLLAAGFVLACSLTFAATYPSWKSGTGQLEAFSRLSTDEKACAVAIRYEDWEEVGGYTYLHRRIPILVFRDFAWANPVVGAFNRVVASESIALPVQGFSPASCRDGVCVYQRAGACQAGGAEYEINEVLRRQGAP